LDRESEEFVRCGEANCWQAAASLTPTSKTKDPRCLNADSKPSIPFSSLGPTVLEIGRHLWHKDATPTNIISVIFRIRLPKVGMNRGFVNNGVCIIRAFQGIRFAIHNFLSMRPPEAVSAFRVRILLSNRFVKPSKRVGKIQ